MQLNGWIQFERQVRWSDVFYHVEDLWLYLLLKIVLLVKDVVPFAGILLNMGQYVRAIHLLWEGLCFSNVKKRDFYSHSRIQRLVKRPEKRLEKLCLIKAERFSHGFLFTVSGMEESANGRKLAEMEEASTVKEQSKNRKNLFYLTASESVVDDS